mmetsp:Transcript_47989/g.88327  ORF Transcript_47989/g.88327 Transcript_47989/m.88327 type:complete len:194 (+) Transcript_47989:41-622(+)
MPGTKIVPKGMDTTGTKGISPAERKRIQEDCDRIAAHRQLHDVQIACERIEAQNQRISADVEYYEKLGESLGRPVDDIIHSDCIHCQQRLMEEIEIEKYRVEARRQAANMIRQEVSENSKRAKDARIEARVRRMQAERRRETAAKTLAETLADVSATADINSFDDDDEDAHVPPLGDRVDPERGNCNTLFCKC